MITFRHVKTALVQRDWTISIYTITNHTMLSSVIGGGSSSYSFLGALQVSNQKKMERLELNTEYKPKQIAIRKIRNRKLELHPC